MRRGGGLGLGAVIFAMTALPSAAAEPSTTGRILVSLQAGQALPADVAARAGTVAAGPRVPQIGLVTVRPLPGVPAAAALRALRSDPRVRAAAPEGRFTQRFTPDDPALRLPEPDSPVADTPLQWTVARHGLPRAWEITRGAGAQVAVIDTGVEADHPDLAGKIAAAIDLDGGGAGPATRDDDGHGTHVASLACAATDNGIGIAGAGFDCSLIVVKSDLTDSSVAAGIVAATDRGAHAINMSFGDDGQGRSPALADAVDYAVDRGVVLVAAAADEPVEEQGEPANLLQPSGTGNDLAAGRGLTVTAADASDRRASFAGRGSQISLAAYGALDSRDGVQGLLGAYPKARSARERGTVLPPEPPCGCRTSLDGDDRWAYLAGTSMAAPQVAAIAAMVRRLNPDLSAREVVRIVKQTARRRGGDAWGPELGWGIVDAGAAVEAAGAIDRRPPASRLRARRAGRRAALRWRGSDRARDGLRASGVAAFEVYRSVDGGAPRRIARRSGRSLTVRLKPGREYAFHTIAIDRAGNREAAPSRADATLRLG